VCGIVIERRITIIAVYISRPESMLRTHETNGGGALIAENHY
jgi:hypothetical protein